MSINSMFQVPLAIDHSSNGTSDFRLGLSVAGWWVLRETTGQKAGIFRTREAAIKFARDESPAGLFTIIFEPNGLEFDDGSLRHAA